MPGSLLVEAESFENLGGWVVDQQSMDQMGSPYLLAHGLGRPVDDATTTVVLPTAGRYRVWVRTRDWVAPWGASGAPGRLQVLIDGKPLAVVFGTEGSEWHWQDGGIVEVAQEQPSVALHDLTGFDGRCDAILFTSDLEGCPPDLGQPLADLRRRPDAPEDVGEFDLVVAGGGIAGICAAVSAARLGLAVALIHDRPVLGGNNSSEVRVGLSGKIHQEPYPRLGDLVEEIGPIGHHDFQEARQHPNRPGSQRVLAMDPIKEVHNAGPSSNYEDDKKLRVVEAEPTLRLFLNSHVVRVEKAGDEIVAVIARDVRTGRERRFRCRLVADCTGDATLGALAGADYRVGREARSETGEALAPETADSLVMGTSVQWFATEHDEPFPFSDCPWALQFDETTCQRTTKGDWNWETGMDLDQIEDFERVRDHALRVVYGNWAFLRNQSRDRADFANHQLEWVACIGGKRESRRLLGDVILQQQDLEEAKPYPDACVTTTWGIDLHYPSPENTRHFPGQEFRSIAKTQRIEPYPIPFRCLYSRNIPNLLMAGRNISVTHVALGTIRVQKTTGMMGEVVGMAASVCRKHEVLPKDVASEHFEELAALMRIGSGRSLR